MIDGGSISVTGQITGSDVVCFSYFNILRRWWLLGFIFLLLATFFIQALASGEDGAFLKAVPFLLLGTFWAGAMIYLPRLSARKVMATQASFREPITWTFSPEAIRVRSCVSESEMKWPVYYKVCETGSCFLLFVSSQMTQILPKHVPPAGRAGVRVSWSSSSWLAHGNHIVLLISSRVSECA